MSEDIQHDDPSVSVEFVGRLMLIETPLQRNLAARTKSSARAVRNARLRASNRVVSLNVDLQMGRFRSK